MFFNRNLIRQKAPTLIEKMGFKLLTEDSFEYGLNGGKVSYIVRDQNIKYCIHITAIFGQIRVEEVFTLTENERGIRIDENSQS